MAIVTLKDVFVECNKEKAVGAFNVHNLEFISGVIKGAEEKNSSVIMMINEAVLKYGEIEVLGQACMAKAKKSKVDVAVMVDHGKDVDFLKRCLDFGLDIMYDGSDLPLEKNIENTCLLKKYAKTRNLSVEGEIGTLGQAEDGDESFESKVTTVKEAVEFVEKTSVDALAVSVGNAHGLYNGEVKIRVGRIREISQATGKMPIVMHGGSDIPDRIVKESILSGIRKFNIATELKIAYCLAMRELVCKEPMEIQPLKLFPIVADKIGEIVQNKIKLFNLEV